MWGCWGAACLLEGEQLLVANAGAVPSALLQQIDRLLLLAGHRARALCPLALQFIRLRALTDVVLLRELIAPGDVDNAVHRYALCCGEIEKLLTE